MKTLARIVSPTLDEIDQLRTPLESGEKQVLDFFMHHLSLSWEIYIQPHLNGLRPDYVLLNPSVGIAVFEVKNWNLAAMRYWVDERCTPPRLMGNDGGPDFDMTSKDPVRKIRYYKQMIEELFCPRMNCNAAKALITAGIIFTSADTYSTTKLLNPILEHYKMRTSKAAQYYPVSGYDAIQAGDVHSVFPEALRKRSYQMEPEYARDLRSWLIEPSVSSEQRASLPLDPRQMELVTTRTKTGYRRIRGSAGSGKSLVLAARAGRLVEEGKQVLVVTYNITLLHYLQDIAVRWSDKSRKARSVATWWNFHLWCRHVCIEAGKGDEYSALWKAFMTSASQMSNSYKDELDKFLSVDLPDFVAGVLALGNDSVLKYDAILVDEGQDYYPKWWNILRKVLKPGGEMLLVADSTQDIYGTAIRWTDQSLAGLDTGFVGGWAELEVSYRMPSSYIPSVREYAAKYMKSELQNLPNPQPELPNAFPCHQRWVQVHRGSPVSVCCDEIVKLLSRNTDPAIPVADVVFLSPRIKEGLAVIERMSTQYHYEFAHTFSEDEEEGRKLKHGFFLGDARFKATTIHSFKGYESRALVVFIDNCPVQPNHALLYVALTRLKEDTRGSYITVVCADAELASYGKTWTDYRAIEAEI